MLVKAKLSPQAHMRDLAAPFEKGLARFDGLRKNTAFCRTVLWQLLVYPISLPDNLTTPARAVTLATAYYPEMRTDAQQMLGYVFPSLDVVTGFALYLEETYGGVGETWLTTLVEGISLWPDPPLIDNQAKAKAYIESLLPYVNSLHARLLAVIKPGKPRLKASLSGGEKSWRPQSPRQIERNKAKTARRKKPS